MFTYAQISPIENALLYAFAFKMTVILSGVLLCYWGYRLFIVGIFSASGDIEATWNNKKMLIRKASPGIFFALFGSVILGISCYKGMHYSEKSSDLAGVEQGLRKLEGKVGQMDSARIRSLLEREASSSRPVDGVSLESDSDAVKSFGKRELEMEVRANK